MTCNHEWWAGVCGGWRKSNLDPPPNQKFLDPFLGVSFSGVSYLKRSSCNTNCFIWGRASLS